MTQKTQKNFLAAQLWEYLGQNLGNLGEIFKIYQILREIRSLDQILQFRNLKDLGGLYLLVTLRFIKCVFC